MSQQTSSKKNSASLLPQPEDGNIPVMLGLLRQQEGILDTTLMTSSILDPPRKKGKIYPTEEELPIVVSAPPNKKMTLSDRKNVSQKPTPNTKSSGMSGQVSISNGKASSEWWTSSSEERSRKLLSLTKTDFVGSPSTFCPGYVLGRIPSSSFKIRSSEAQNRNSQKISWPSSMFSPADSTVKDATIRKIKARKIRLKPTPCQTKVLREWFLSGRKTYNWALKLIKEKKAKPNLLLKKFVVTRRETDKGSRVEDVKKTPAAVRVSYVRDLVKNFKSAIEIRG